MVYWGFLDVLSVSNNASINYTVRTDISSHSRNRRPAFKIYFMRTLSFLEDRNRSLAPLIRCSWRRPQKGAKAYLINYFAVSDNKCKFVIYRLAFIDCWFMWLRIENTTHFSHKYTHTHTHTQLKTQHISVINTYICQASRDFGHKYGMLSFNVSNHLKILMHFVERWHKICSSK